MLQYILNATSIWLISLVLFDVFLRRESYHGYNRLYLLGTFLMGLFLPLWQWQDKGVVHNVVLQRPIISVIDTKEAIVVTGKAATIHIEQWLLIIYLTGVFIALCILAADIIKLVSLYRNGKKSRQGRWIIVATGNGHAPFSFFNTLFVCSREQYSTEEWNMILEHEGQHTALFHFADLLLMQLSRVVLWFHPLVYLYNKRLLMVHEYQADITKAQPKEYGRFLVTQALMQNAPSITHSFNRSPIKNRIVMLTHTSTAASKIKLFVFVPLALISVICFSKNAISQATTKEKLMGRLAGKSMGQATTEQLLANPVVSASDPEYKVTGFTVTFIPKGRDLHGPYKTKGEKLPDNAIELIKEFKGTRYNVAIEDIHMTKGGKDTILTNAVFLKCD